MAIMYEVIRNLKNGDIDCDCVPFDNREEAERWCECTWNRLTEKEKAKYKGFYVEEFEIEEGIYD